MTGQPDPQQLRAWYLDEGVSAATIAQRLNLTPATARRRLLAVGIKMRTRREQIEFQDRLAGRSEPTRDELLAGYERERLTMEELGERHGMNPSRIRILLHRHDITIRTSGQRPELIDAERARRRGERPVAQFVELYEAGWSATAIAEHTGSNRKLVVADLRDAGVDLRRLAPLEEWIDRYIVDGETAAEISETYGVTAAAVYEAMREAGVARRPAVVRHRHVDDTVIVGMFVDDEITIGRIGDELGISMYLVRAALRRNDVNTLRRSPLDEDRLAALYEAGLTLGAIADKLKESRSRVRNAIKRLGLPKRQPHRTELTIPTNELRALLDAGVNDDEIARQHKVAAYAVRRRRRKEQLRRPKRPTPPLSRTGLQNRLDNGATLSEIASEHRVALASVRRWCDYHGIERTTEAARNRRHDGVHLNPVHLEQMYSHEQQTIKQVASHFDVDSAIVAFELHSHRIPVRRSGQSTAPGTVVLDALYDDPDINKVLEHHAVPIRPEGGHLLERFPDPRPVDDELLDYLYCRVGLSTMHISLLTGHSPAVVRDHLRQFGVALRKGRSPWFSRTLTNDA